MRFMIIVKASAASEAGVMPTEAKLKEMGDFHEELARAGVLIDGSGLRATALGWRVHYDGAKRSVVDGPFAETKELIAGYTLIRTNSREEAIEWSRRFPNPNLDDSPCHIEVRQMFELEDFEPSPTLDQFRAIGMGGETGATP
jgi:hypothetical protein